MNIKFGIRAALLAVLVSLACVSTSAEALKRNQVAGDAKWLLHLDLENFRGTQVGKFFHDNVLEKALEEARSNFPFDVGALLEKVSSITAYGSDYEKNPEASAVLIIKTDSKGQEIVEGLIAAQLLANTNGLLKKLQTDPYPLYSINNQIFASIQPNHVLLLGKSRNHHDKAREVLLGKIANLNSSKTFSQFPNTPDMFFFLGIAEGFNQNAAMPPQARILQMADGGRVVLGEKADRLCLDLALKGKSKEVVTQIQQVVQGMIALFSLGQPKNKDLSELMQSTKVSTSENVVSVGVEYPVQKALIKLAEQINDKPKSKKAKSSKKVQQPATETAEEEEKPEPKDADKGTTDAK